MEDKIRICFATPQLSYGGAERVVSVLAGKLAELGHDVSIIIYDRKNDEYQTSDKVKRYYLCDETYSRVSVIRRIQRIMYVRKYIKKHRFEFIVPFLERAVIQTFIATRGLNIKFISTLRNNPYELSRSERIKTDFIAWFADAHFVQNQSQKSYYCKKIQRKTFVVSNPVNEIFIEHSKNYSEHVKKIVSMGRLFPQKNYDLLIDAIKLVYEKYKDISVYIWGIGTEHNRLSERIKSEGLEKCMFLKGRTQDVEGAMADADLFVMTSDYEGMPNSLLEAMTYGMPCISTDCPTGPSELIKSGENGILVPLKDKKALAESIMWFIENPEKAILCGKNARKSVVEKHTADYICKKFLDECRGIR
ncbi:glycosyltransferase family 4 protein [Butyrivibrio sp. WCD3002]|uniref:glycosyltransferase family 4 protein n=1 Tax=Butyrivibrio sp. WCD3002 TaxID=1280676 RepID=UPI0004205112|nr:glycosyltransferase family 4 protein [Butyrivibrio sp. WCD3002]